MKILSIGASSSSTSINQKLADYTASKIKNAKVTSYPLRLITLPVYSEDEEKENGIPAGAQQFLDTIRAHDGIVLSLAEHNGSYTAAFKNLYDWTSRIEQNLWSDKPMLLLSTSPGPRGATTVMEAGKSTFPRMGAKLAATFSLPSFYENFTDQGIKDDQLASHLDDAVTSFISTLTV